MRLRALKDRLVVQPVTVESTSAGGIITSLRPKNEGGVGVVLAAGPDCTGVRQGDRVVFDPKMVDAVTIQGTQLYAMREHDVGAVLESAS